jgi:hypothetical protein
LGQTYYSWNSNGELNMRALIAIALLALAASPALADGTCKSQAEAKKLSGAALTNFTKKCAADAATTCDTQAAAKKLAGAAKNSFVKKCVSDTTG